LPARWGADALARAGFYTTKTQSGHSSRNFAAMHAIRSVAIQAARGNARNSLALAMAQGISNRLSSLPLASNSPGSKDG